MDFDNLSACQEFEESKSNMYNKIVFWQFIALCSNEMIIDFII